MPGGGNRPRQRSCYWRKHRLGIRRRKSVLTPVLPHLVLLVGQDAQVGPRLARAQQYESGLPILGKVADGIRLIHLSTLEQSSSASQAAPLVAECRHCDSGFQGSIPDVLVSPHRNGLFSFGRDQGYLVGWDF